MPLLGVFCHRRLGFDTVYCIQNLGPTDSNFSRSRDITGGVKFKVGHVTLTTPNASFKVDVILMLGLDIAYTCMQNLTTLPSAVPEIRCGSRDLTTPLSGIVYRPWTSTCYDQPIYQIWSLLSLSTTKIRKAIQNVGNVVVLGGFWSLKVTGNSAIW